MARRISWLAVTGVLALAAAACGGSGGGSGGSGGGSGGGGSSKPKSTPTASATKSASAGKSAGGKSAGGGTTVGIAAPASGALKFTTSTLHAKAGKDTFEFNNPSQVPHAFSIEGNGVRTSTKVITGGRAAVTVKLKPGTYTFFCPVPGHRQAGMVGKLTVTKAA